MSNTRYRLEFQLNVHVHSCNTYYTLYIIDSIDTDGVEINVFLTFAHKKKINIEILLTIIKKKF